MASLITTSPEIRSLLEKLSIANARIAELEADREAFAAQLNMPASELYNVIRERDDANARAEAAEAEAARLLGMIETATVGDYWVEYSESASGYPEITHWPNSQHPDFHVVMTGQDKPEYFTTFAEARARADSLKSEENKDA